MQQTHEPKQDGLFVQYFGRTTRNRVLSTLVRNPDQTYTARELQEAISYEAPTVSKSTVYDTLHQLVGEGLVKKDGKKGQARSYKLHRKKSKPLRKAYMSLLTNY